MITVGRIDAQGFLVSKATVQDISQVGAIAGLQVELIDFEIPPKPFTYSKFEWQTRTWVDQRTLQEIKDAQWDLIKQSRANAEYAGFMWDGSKFDSDILSQQRITGAVSLAMLSSTFSIQWTLFDNTVRTLSASDMIGVGSALGTHVATQFAIGVTLRDQITAATSRAEVEAVVW